MTLNLLTFVPEGMVLLVDSMSTSETFVPFQGPKITTFDHAMKLFELGTGLKIAAMVSGVGDVGGTLVSQLLRTASLDLDQHGAPNHAACVTAVKTAVDPVYTALINTSRQATLDIVRADPDGLQHINQIRAQRGRPPLASIDEFTIDSIGIAGDAATADRDLVVPAPILEIVVASYTDSYNATAIRWPGAPIETHVISDSGPVGNVWWWGSGSSALSRIVRGYDVGLVQQAAQTGDPSAQAVVAYYNSPQESIRHQMPMLLSVMPLQEAVYFSEYLGDVACGFDRFKAGAAGVGGAINVMVITDAERKWLRRDSIRSRELRVE